MCDFIEAWVILMQNINCKLSILDRTSTKQLRTLISEYLIFDVLELDSDIKISLWFKSKTVPIQKMNMKFIIN